MRKSAYHRRADIAQYMLRHGKATTDTKKSYAAEQRTCTGERRPVRNN